MILGRKLLRGALDADIDSPSTDTEAVGKGWYDRCYLYKRCTQIRVRGLGVDYT